MKLATEVMLDGLIRALRWTAHNLAEAVESGQAIEPANERPARRPQRQITEQADDRAGR
jgi:hypothetical protein